MIENKKFKRIFLIVIDSLGIGYDKEAKNFNDEGSNTLSHIIDSVDSINIPNLYSLGLTNLIKNKKFIYNDNQKGYSFRLHELSNAKSTMEGHFEMMGVLTKIPFLTFTENGFPKELIDEIEKKTGHKVIGNKAASGTEIIKELGEVEINEHKMIVYTSADSVLQVCGHEESFDLKELYRCCEIIREITMKPEWRVGRVIARPYIGKNKNDFVRTSNRRDYAIKPPIDTALNILDENNFDVIGIGKIHDIFSGEGINRTLHSDSSIHGMEQTIDILKNDDFKGLCFVNLVDFDAKWGHRRNPIGYAKEIENFDEKLKIFIDNMKNDDLLMITADHGNDPTFRGTDHTREYVPLIIYSNDFTSPKNCPDQESFSVIGNMILENFNLEPNDDMIKNKLLI